EEFTNTTASLAPAALAPGSLGQRLLRPLMGGAGIEGAGQVAREVAPEYEEAARLIAGLVMGAAAGKGQPQFGFQQRAALERLGTNPAAVKRMQAILMEQGMSPEDVAGKMRDLGLQAMP